MSLRSAIAVVGLSFSALSGCADGTSYMEDLPTGVSVMEFNRSGAQFSCTSDAFENGNCDNAVSGYCMSIGKATEEGMGVLPDESIGQTRGWYGVSCFAKWKDIQ